MNTARGYLPVGRAPGDVTRYLCAAAYLDDAFADRVVEDVLADEASAAVPAPGVDLVAVVRHSLAAQTLHNRRDLRLTVSFLLVAVTAPLWLALVALVFRIPRRPATGRDRAVRDRAARGQRLSAGSLLTSIGTAAGLLVVITLCAGLTASSLPLSGFTGWLLGAYLHGVPAALAFLAAVTYAYATVVDHDLDVDLLLRTGLTREAFDPADAPAPPPQEWIAGRLTALAEARDGNVTVYSGYSPWVGYPEALSEWPLTVPLLPAEDALGRKDGAGGPRPFTVPDLVAHVRAQLHEIAGHHDATPGAATTGGRPQDTPDQADFLGFLGSLGSLVVEDRIFVKGTTIGDDERFLREEALSPAARLPADAVEQIMLSPTGTLRHQLAIHLPLWGGDIVPTVFLHFATVGRTLHLRVVNHLLGPVRAEYHAVDRLRGPLAEDARRALFVDALRHTGAKLIAAPRRADRQSRFDAHHDQWMADEIKAMEQDPEYDFGARTSIRALALSPEYHDYFQLVDAQQILSLVQRHTLLAVREFLDARGWDTTDLRDQQQTILNQGVIQQGGLSIVGNQAVGPDATATQHLPRQGGAGAPGPTARPTQ
ncbi:hypothetical protein ELQ87_38635 [Streptomyces griseoviridis]|uniref:Uncharacterized protein n=1 Tax=Streptomyces griseoviridis TaxID=45398 RepID=A0A3Q9L1D6_STRGD|nr:hypothetical protein [Streptomyces griseoviridis]AZS89511.1 hypothetical protein ELQ87_38635 [Streptomyces griseoviridis]QCN83650.1 hypothetical protein DDJ31_00600 [Streptomyces griseoviridis]